MGFLDIFKTKKKADNIQWTLRVAEDEMPIEPETFEININIFLQDLERGDIEFIVLSPSEVVNGITFLQVASNNNDYMHVEAGLNEKNSQGRPRILYHDDVSVGECLDMFIAFYRQGKVDTVGWKELGWKT